MRLCLLGGGVFKHSGVDKLDVACALINGIIDAGLDARGPKLFFAYDEGVFRLAWKDARRCATSGKIKLM